MITAFDRFFLVEHQLPAPLLKTLSALSDPKLNLLVLGTISLYLLLKRGMRAFSSLFLILFAYTGWVMFFCGVLKICMGRARPYLLEEGISGFFFFSVKQSYLSFPSSHTALATCFSIALQRRYSNYSIFLYPILIGASRVLLFAHFASDILAGIVVGIGVEHFVRLYYEKMVSGIKKLGNPKAS